MQAYAKCILQQGSYGQQNMLLPLLSLAKDSPTLMVLVVGLVVQLVVQLVSQWVLRFVLQFGLTFCFTDGLAVIIEVCLIRGWSYTSFCSWSYISFYSWVVCVWSYSFTYGCHLFN